MLTALRLHGQPFAKPYPISYFPIPNNNNECGQSTRANCRNIDIHKILYTCTLVLSLQCISYIAHIICAAFRCCVL